MSADSPRARLDYASAQVDPSRTVEIPLRDALFVYQTLGEFIHFFHQRMQWERLEEVEAFIGNQRSGGGLDVLVEAYYKRMRDIWPGDVERDFDEGRFDPPYGA